MVLVGVLLDPINVDYVLAFFWGGLEATCVFYVIDFLDVISSLFLLLVFWFVVRSCQGRPLEIRHRIPNER